MLNSLFFLAQVGGGVVDKTLDALFTSPPALVVFFVMIVAIVSIPVLGWGFLQTFRKMQADNGTMVNQLTATIAQLTKTLDGSQSHANSAQEENSENYLSIKTYFDQSQGILTGMQSDLAKTQRALTETQLVISQHVADVTNLHAQTRNELKTNLTNRLADALEIGLSQRRIDLFDTFNPPPDDDCRYQLKLIRQAPDLSESHILLYKAPIFRDGNEAGKLRGSGEIVKIIIDTAFPGWCYVKQAFGDKVLAGYARTRTIVIMELPTNPEEREP